MRRTGAPADAGALDESRRRAAPEYFSDGLTEELLNALVKIPGLKVTGRTSSFSFKGKNEDLRDIGKKLGVANILEGSVRKSGDRLRITAELVKAEDGFHLWSAAYDRTLDDIFAVQDDIAGHVADELKVTLLGRRAENTRTDAGAYDLVLQARLAMGVRTERRKRRAARCWRSRRTIRASTSFSETFTSCGESRTRHGSRTRGSPRPWTWGTGAGSTTRR